MVAQPVCVRQEGQRTLDQADRCRHVGAPHGASGGGGKPFTGTLRKLPQRSRRLGELGAVAVRLLQVVADDLVSLGEMLGADGVEPVREALVSSARALSAWLHKRRPG